MCNIYIYNLRLLAIACLYPQELKNTEKGTPPGGLVEVFFFAMFPLQGPSLGRETNRKIVHIYNFYGFFISPPAR